MQHFPFAQYKIIFTIDYRACSEFFIHHGVRRRGFVDHFCRCDWRWRIEISLVSFWIVEVKLPTGHQKSKWVCWFRIAVVAWTEIACFVSIMSSCCYRFTLSISNRNFKTIILCVIKWIRMLNVEPMKCEMSVWFDHV